jgi:O-methyltransferase involved in polyketide biosynthesis
MAAEKPKCRLDRVAADVTDQAQRATLFAAVGVPTLIITEGLLMYLGGPRSKPSRPWV